jgi:hypothetical protein
VLHPNAPLIKGCNTHSRVARAANVEHDAN